MKTSRIARLAFLLQAALLSLPLCAQDDLGLWAGAGIEKGFGKGFDIGAGGEFRWKGEHTDRFSVDLSASKRLYRNEAKTFAIKAGLSYKFSEIFYFREIKYAGSKGDEIPNGMPESYYVDNGYIYNILNSHWRARHRITASLSAKQEIGRLTLSVKERYQFSFMDSISVPMDAYRFVYNHKVDDWTLGLSYHDKKHKKIKHSQILRSGLEAAYNIPDWKFDPYCGIEFFNDIEDRLALDKSRLTGGIEWKITKAQSLKMEYIWQDKADDDEAAGSAISLSYKFNF